MEARKLCARAPKNIKAWGKKWASL